MYNKRDFKACDARETAVYSVVNEDFEGEYNAKITLLDDSYARQTPKEPLKMIFSNIRGYLHLAPTEDNLYHTSTSATAGMRI